MTILTNLSHLTSAYKSISLLLISTLFIASCGGAKSSASVVQSAPTIPATVTITYDVNEIKFSWDKNQGETSYQLLSQLNPGGDFVVIQDALVSTTTSLLIPVHLYNWATVQYKIRSCNSLGCIDSDAVAIKNQSANAIGYIKAINNGSGDEFGTAVALSGDGNTLAISAVKEDSIDVLNLDDGSAIDSGAVYIYSKINNKWQFKQYIKALPVLPGAQFGSALALDDDGTTLVVGEWLGSDGISSGAAYIFELINEQWNQVKKISAVTPLAIDYFGFSLAVSGDGNTIVIGVPGKVGYLETSKGKLLVFKKVNALWSDVANLITASDSADYDYFGISVDINFDGTRIIAAKEFRASSIYIYDYKITTGNVIKTWVEQKLSATLVNGYTNSGFGAVSIDNSGDVIAFSQVGVQILVFKYELDAISNNQRWINKLKYSSKTPSGVFGGGEILSGFPILIGIGILGVRGSLMLSGDGKNLIVGAAFEATNKNGVFTGFSASDGADANLLYGASYLFQETAANQWTQKRYIKSANSDTNDFFSCAVAISNDGNTVAIGALGESSSNVNNISTITPDKTDNLKINSGAVYVY